MHAIISQIYGHPEARGHLHLFIFQLLVSCPIFDVFSFTAVSIQVFLKVADVYFNGVENLDKGKFNGKFLGQLYGLGGNQTGIYRLGAEEGRARVMLR